MGTGACPDAGAGSCLTPLSAGAIPSSSAGLGWVVKASQPEKHLDTEAMKVSIPTPQAVGQAAKVCCGFTRRLGGLPLAEGRAKCPDA